MITVNFTVLTQSILLCTLICLLMDGKAVEIETNQYSNDDDYQCLSHHYSFPIELEYANHPHPPMRLKPFRHIDVSLLNVCQGISFEKAQYSFFDVDLSLWFYCSLFQGGFFHNPRVLHKNLCSLLYENKSNSQDAVRSWILRARTDLVVRATHPRSSDRVQYKNDAYF